MNPSERAAQFRAARAQKNSETNAPGDGGKPIIMALVPAPRAKQTAPTDEPGIDMRSDAPTSSDPSGEAAKDALERKARDQQKIDLCIRFVADIFNPFQDEDGRFYIDHEGDAVPIKSEHFEDILRVAVLSKGRGINGDQIKHVVSILRQRARQLPARSVARRIHQEGDAHYTDIGDAERQCIKVTTQAITIVSCSEVNALFVRPKGYGELPMPVLPDELHGNKAAAREAFIAMEPVYLGVPPRDRITLASALVERLRADSPNPILVACGIAGSGKTTIGGRWIMLGDPFRVNPPNVDKDVEAIYSSAQSRHNLILDNVGKLKDEVEDLLCISSLGSQLAVREKYTTADSRDLPLKVAWVITSIGMPIRRDDTHSRSLLIRVSAPSNGQKRSDSDMRAEFTAAHPRALGGLLWFLQESMRYRERNANRTSLDRMVDWEVTGEAIAQALGAAAGAYAQSRARARATRAHDFLEGDTYFAVPLMATLHELAKLATPATTLPTDKTVYQDKVWSGNIGGRLLIAATAEGLRDAMRAHAPRGGPELPSTGRQVIGGLDRVQGSMTAAGWNIERKVTNGSRRIYVVIEVPQDIDQYDRT